MATRKTTAPTAAKTATLELERLRLAKKELESKLEGHLPEAYTIPKGRKREVIYVFQGGGALGAYQVGVYEALREHGYTADMIVGISIGSINAAIIAGNKPADRLDRLCEFWDTICTKMPFSAMPNLGFSKPHHWLSSQISILNGQPGFFTPKLINPSFLTDATPDQLSYYDTSPLRETLLRLIDFEYLNQKHMRLCLGSVELSSGDFVFFDSFEQEIGPEHIMASGALPPSFPPIEIDGKFYIDGGVFSNTPLSKVIDEFATSESDIRNVICFMIDLFSISGPLPHSMDGMLERIKDIRFSSHSRRATGLYSTTQNLSHAIHYLTSKMTKEQRSDPKVQKIIKLGYANRLDIIHLVYHSEKGTELESKDYEFSVETANKHRQMGYINTVNIINAEEKDWMNKRNSGVTIYTQGSDNAQKTKL